MKVYPITHREQPEKTHRYFLFAYDTYYPGGGFNDLVASGNDHDELLAWMVESNNVGNNFHVLDFDKKELVNK